MVWSNGGKVWQDTSGPLPLACGARFLRFFFVVFLPYKSIGVNVLHISLIRIYTPLHTNRRICRNIFGRVVFLKYMCQTIWWYFSAWFLNNIHQGWLLLRSNKHRKGFVKIGPDTNRTACMSMDLDRLCVMVSLYIPNVVYLLDAAGVGLCWGYTISSNVVLITSASFLLINKVPISASAAEDTTCLIIYAITKIVPLCMLGLLES